MNNTIVAMVAGVAAGLWVGCGAGRAVDGAERTPPAEPAAAPAAPGESGDEAPSPGDEADDGAADQDAAREPDSAQAECAALRQLVSACLQRLDSVAADSCLTCLRASPEDTLEFCAAAAGAPRCDGAQPTQAGAAWCRLSACVAGPASGCDGRDAPQCGDPPPSEPPPDDTVPEPLSPGTDAGDDVCARIQARAGHCPGFGYTCPGRSPTESECFLAVLEGLTDPCPLFAEDRLCAQGDLSVVGRASCQVQACFGVSELSACYEGLSVLCAFVGPG